MEEGPNEKKENSLKSDLTINYKPGTHDEPVEAVVGNTGLFLIRQIDSDWQLHFFPDDHKDAVPGKERDYALRFLGGLHALLDWWSSSQNPHVQDNFVMVAANARFYGFLQRNLPGALGLIYEDRHPKMFFCQLSLDYVRANEVLMNNLSRARQSLLTS